MLHRSWQAATAVALLGLVVGCSNDQVAPTDQDEALAVAFDGLMAEANTAGDADAGAAFSGAALAVRLGVRPTDIPVSIDGEVRRYRAFVHEVNANRAGVNTTLRTMVAYRPNDAGRPEEVLYLALPADSADFSHPAVTDAAAPRKHGVSSWKDLVAKQFYVATRGYGVLVGTERLGECPKVSPRDNVKCTLAKFTERVDGLYPALIRNQRGQFDPNKSVRIISRADGVNGAVLTIN